MFVVVVIAADFAAAGNEDFAAADIDDVVAAVDAAIHNADFDDVENACCFAVVDIAVAADTAVVVA